MDYRNTAYGIGQRRQPSDASSSFAPTRLSGGGAINDNFRGTQSMNFRHADNFNYGNNSSQRNTDIDNKFGSMQSSNYGRSADNTFINNNQQRYASVSRGPDIVSATLSNFRGQQQQQPQQQQSSFLGHSQSQRFNLSDNNLNSSNDVFNVRPGSGVVDGFRGTQPQQQQLPTSLGLRRTGSDLSQNENNQRYFNNDTFRRSDNFNDNFRGQESNNLARPGPSYNFNNDRSDTSGRSNSASNFGYNDRSFGSNFRGQQPVDFVGNFPNKIDQPFFNSPQNVAGNNNAQNYSGPNNAEHPGQALAVFNETVNALIKNQPHWQVGNNNAGFGQPNYNAAGNRNTKWNFENSGPNLNRANAAQVNNNRGQGQNRVFKQTNYKQQQQQPPISARKPPAGFNKFPNVPNVPNVPNKNQPKPNIKLEPNIKKEANQQQSPKPAVARNLNGGKPVAGVSTKPNPLPQNTQPKDAPNKQPEVKKNAANANVKAGQKRVAEQPTAPPTAPPTKADIKRRKIALKRGFLLGGFKLPYINNNKLTLPQPEDKSYAIMFFEQTPNYSTSGEELDDEPFAGLQEFDKDAKNAGRTLVKRIRKRLHFEWTLMEEQKKYSSWQTWWTDFKWCEAALKETLDTFESTNLRNCFIPDLPRLTTEQVVDVIIKSAQFGLEKNSDNYYNNMKSIFTLMNITFLEHLKPPNTERVQDIIRAVPNAFWTYKMRSMVYLWAQYLKISKTSSPSTETGAKELQAIERDWKNPLFHWIAKQAFDELKAISEVEWPEHKQLYGSLESTDPTK